MGLPDMNIYDPSSSPHRAARRDIKTPFTSSPRRAARRDVKTKYIHKFADAREVEMVARCGRK